MRYGIENPFVIGIKTKTTKLHQQLEYLRTFGLDPIPFLGFDAEISGLDTSHLYEIDHPGSGFKIGPKPTNIALSHIMLWRCLSMVDADYFVVFEDDARLDPDWRVHFDSAISHMAPDWDLLFIGSCCCEGRVIRRIHNRLHTVNYAACLHSLAIRKKALPTMCMCSEKIWAPIDVSVAVMAVPILKSYAILPRVCYQLNTEIPP